MKSLKFSFDTTDLSSLNASFDKGRELIYKPFEAVSVFDKITLLENIKSGDPLPLVDFTPTFAAGGCGYSNDNDVLLSDATLETKLLKSDVTLCPNDLVKSGFERYLPSGANVEDLSFEDALQTYLIAKYAKAIRDIAFGGTSATTHIDGIVTRVYNATGVLEVTGTAPTAADAMTKLFAIYAKMPGEVLSTDARPVIFIGFDWLKNAVLQTYNDNRYYGNVAIDAENGFILPATNVRVQGLDILNNTNKAIAGSGNLMFVGTDLADDLSTLQYWYSQDNQEIRSRIQFRLGTQIAFPSLFVRYKIQQGGGGQ